MKIRFLKNCTTPQEWSREVGGPCDCCKHYENAGYEQEFFFAGQEEDPNVENQKIDLTGLKYRVDYDIVEYP
jgi:hypothetical protein